MNKKRKFRYINKGEFPLSDHEINELKVDFDIDVKGFYVLAPLTKKEWDLLNKEIEKCNWRGVLE